MSDIIDFNEIKNKVKDKDVDKFQDYIFGLYYSMASGSITMADLYREVRKYMEDNNISEEKLFNIEKKLMDRYGLDMDSMQEQMKSMGIGIPDLGGEKGYEEIRKVQGFQEKYKDRLKPVTYNSYSIKNSTNDLELILSENRVILRSNKRINLQDTELNEFLVSYKKLIDNKSLEIFLCDEGSRFEY